ncbi:hypothetical protein [Micromonospora sp. NPDC049799]|uniref:hypothetical protein n=1 Tax=Micromonospora sp. NPDC049799 TaxID=3154741 RepID=UPI0033CF418C
MTVEPAEPMRAERLDAVTRGLTTDLRTVRGVTVRHATTTSAAHGKSPEAWALGMLVVGGLFSATTMRAIVQIVIANADRAKARSIRLRRGDAEVVITGQSRVDDPALVGQLAQLLGAAEAAPTPPGPVASVAGPRSPEDETGRPGV